MARHKDEARRTLEESLVGVDEAAATRARTALERILADTEGKLAGQEPLDLSPPVVNTPEELGEVWPEGDDESSDNPRVEVYVAGLNVQVVRQHLLAALLELDPRGQELLRRVHGGDLSGGPYEDWATVNVFGTPGLVPSRPDQPRLRAYREALLQLLEAWGLRDARSQARTVRVDVPGVGDMEAPVDPPPTWAEQLYAGVQMSGVPIPVMQGTPFLPRRRGRPRRDEARSPWEGHAPKQRGRPPEETTLWADVRALARRILGVPWRAVLLAYAEDLEALAEGHKAQEAREAATLLRDSLVNASAFQELRRGVGYWRQTLGLPHANQPENPPTSVL